VAEVKKSVDLLIHELGEMSAERWAKPGLGPPARSGGARAPRRRPA
jgi:hypothetical protein